MVRGPHSRRETSRSRSASENDRWSACSATTTASSHAPSTACSTPRASGSSARRSARRRRTPGRPRLPPPPARTPQANGVAERFVGTARRECLDWILIANRRHLQHVLREFIDHYNRHRPHRALGLTPPEPGQPTRPLATPRATAVRRHDRLGGLIHEYSIAA